jgi:iron complex transport system substrate-binding protein
VNASAYFSRPGSRLIDGLELLAHIFHPELALELPAGTEAVEVDLSAPTGAR